MNITNVFRKIIKSHISFRSYATVPPKRFYKQTGILSHGGQYEITLDQRKLKTPAGNVFTVKSEPLAMAIAAEWDSQKEVVQRDTMHLTVLCSIAIDNPTKKTKFDLANHALTFLEGDTMLFYSEETDLEKVQMTEWEPIRKWFCERYGVSIEPSRSMEGPIISPECKDILQRHILSFNYNSVLGLVFAAESLKSLILALACIDRKLMSDQAVRLSRLEEDFQIKHWGRVEWAHDIAQHDLQARVAAAILFIHLNSMDISKQSKFSENRVS